MSDAPPRPPAGPLVAWRSPRPPRRHSLRARLQALVLGAILLACAVLATAAYRNALREADALFDEHLQQLARQVQEGLPLGALHPGQSEGGGIEVQVWGPDGLQIFRSPRSVLPGRAVLGFSDLEVDGARYRVYTLQSPLQTVQIAQDMGERDARARGLALRAVLPLLGITPLLMLVVGWIIGRTLRPVQRMQRQVAQRSADDLAPLPDRDLPDEVRPLVAELNALFARVQTTLQTQRHFVADAAHELRTPLTALRLQLQALQRAPDDAAREQAQQRLREGIDRAIDMVAQLLLLARHESLDAAAQRAAVPVDLLALTREGVADALPLARARGLDLGLADGTVEGPWSVPGQPEGLRVLLRNLLDNAIKYTPGPGQIDVGLQRDPVSGQPVWWVEDSGPGIPAAQRSRVRDRFMRGDAVSDIPGSGLGLAIVEAVARQHGARLELGDAVRLGGLRVSVHFAPEAGSPT
ncbi:ATP-binding protein [Curvibacter sp. HBC61]|uniref:histidine kinase n=1 Tax=Curvibacter cyanobacteriorum TaxID=3026422 RepID=A0ABT5MWM9_9BURK|nr:ATP-binding protein [Curvibacter sp. HBC61]MDD0838454.1 ATP-binding protein [Curvibacter sp. HBC61]